MNEDTLDTELSHRENINNDISAFEVVTLANGVKGVIDSNNKFVPLSSGRPAPVSITGPHMTTNTGNVPHIKVQPIGHNTVDVFTQVQAESVAYGFISTLVKNSGLEILHVDLRALLNEIAGATIPTTHTKSPEREKLENLMKLFEQMASSLKACYKTGVKYEDGANLLPRLDDKGRLISYPLSIPLDLEELVDTAGSENMAMFIRSFRDSVKPILMKKFKDEFYKKYPSKPTMALFNDKVIKNKATDFTYIVTSIDDSEKHVSVQEVEYHSDSQSYTKTECILSLPFDVFSQEFEICDSSPRIQ